MQNFSILFIAPKCYQLSSPEAIVNSKLVNAFRRAGHRVVVVSQFRREDQTAGQLIGKEDVYTLQVPGGSSIKGLLMHLFMFLKYGYCYRTIHWALPAIRQCKKLIRDNHFDFILSRSQPSEVVAAVLNRTFHIPWLSNWNDPYPLRNYPPPYGKGPGQTIPNPQRKVLESMGRQVRYFTFPNGRLQQYLKRYFPADLDKKGTIIPHILATKDIHQASRPPSRFILQHSGRLWYPRDPEPFLRAVKAFIDQYRISPDEFELQFIGTQDVSLNDMITEFGITSRVRVTDSVNYAESLRRMEEISFGLVIEADLEEGIFFPSKVADYFQMGKPVLAISPAVGVMKDLSLKVNAVLHVYNRDVDAITQTLGAIYEAWKKDPALKSFAVSRELQLAYSDEQAVHKYEDLFAEILKQNV